VLLVVVVLVNQVLADLTVQQLALAELAAELVVLVVLWAE
jgi:hypothetical protein